MNLGGVIETSIVRPLGILFALIKIKIGQGSYKSGRFIGSPFMIPFLVICHILVIKK